MDSDHRDDAELDDAELDDAEIDDAELDAADLELEATSNLAATAQLSSSAQWASQRIQAAHRGHASRKNLQLQRQQLRLEARDRAVRRVRLPVRVESRQLRGRGLADTSGSA